MKCSLVGYSGASEITGLCEGTLYSKVCRKEIPHIRLSPRLVRFSPEELTEWIAKHRVPVFVPEASGARQRLPHGQTG